MNIKIIFAGSGWRGGPSRIAGFEFSGRSWWSDSLSVDAQETPQRRKHSKENQEIGKGFTWSRKLIDQNNFGNLISFDQVSENQFITY